MNPKIALVDMDGTLCNYEGSLNEKVKDVIGSQANIWDPKYKKLVALIKSQPGFWYDLPVIDFGMSIVKYLQEKDWEVHILTKGPYKTTSAWTEKVEWCRHWLPGVPVTITEDKSLVYGRILFDDFPKYCEAWLKWRPRGLVIMPKYEYNIGFDGKYPVNVIRGGYDNIDDVRRAIDTAAVRKAGTHSGNGDKQ